MSLVPYEKLQFRWYERTAECIERFFFDETSTKRYHDALEGANPHQILGDVLNHYPLALECVYVRTEDRDLESNFAALGFSNRSVVPLRTGYLLFGPALKTIKVQNLSNMLRDEVIDNILFQYGPDH